MADASRYVPQSVTPPPGAVPLTQPGSPGKGWRRPRVFATLALLALLVLALAWHSIDVAHRTLAAGTVVHTEFAMTTPHHAVVDLPWGRIKLATTDPRSALPQDVAGDVGGDVRPPDGGRFVGVSWQADPSAAVGNTISFSPSSAHATRLSLLTGGHSYPVNPGVDASLCATDAYCVGPAPAQAQWLAVDGSAADVQIAVRYDGDTQTADLTRGHVAKGRAAALYGAQLRGPGCGAPTWTPGFSGDHATCKIALIRSPYLAGLGWAPRGRTWVGADVDTDRPATVSYRSGATTGRFYAVSGTRTYSFSLVGGRPAAQQPDGTSDGQLGQPRYADIQGERIAFSVPTGAAAGPLRIHATWGLDPARDHEVTSTTTRQVTATWTVTP